MTIEREIGRLAEGRQTWTQFVQRTDKDWTRLAARQRKRFKVLPAAVELEDIKQELLVAAFKAYEAWDADGGQPLHRWVIVQSVQRCMDWLNVQRRSYRQHSNQPSRVLVRVATLVPKGDDAEFDSPFDGIASVDAVQEEVVAAKRHAEKMTAEAKAKAKTKLDRACFDALARAYYDFDEASRLLRADLSLRLSARLGSNADANRAIQRAIQTHM